MLETCENRVCRGEGGSFFRFPFENEVVLCSILAIATFAVFSPACFYPLLNGWDDHVYVTNAVPHLTMSISNIIYWFTRPHHGCYLPFTMLSYMVDYQFWGLDGGGYHLQNILWHILAVVGVFKCFRVLKVTPLTAFVISLLFALHPQRVESVAWISERKDVMCAAFYFWSVYLYLRSEKFDKWYYLSFLCFLASFLSKPMAASLPCVIFLLNYMKSGSLNVGNQLKRLLPFVLVVLALFPLTYMAHLQMGTVATNRIETFRQFFVVGHNVAWYAVRTFLPRGLSPIYPKVSFVSGTIFFLFFTYLSAILAGVYLYVKKRDVLSRSIAPLVACYLVALVPVVGLVPFGFIDYADRYSYIPSFFLWLGIGRLIQRWLNARIVKQSTKKGDSMVEGMSVVLFFCAISFAVIDNYYIRSWKSIHLLHKMALTHSPPNNEAVKFLADIELAEGHLTEAVRLADILARSREEWMTKKDIALNQLKYEYINAVAAFQNGQSNVAFDALRRVRVPYAKLAKIPGNKRAVADYNTILVLLATCFDRAGRRDEATKCYEELLPYLNPDSRDGLFYRGVVLMRKKQYSAAKDLFAKALRLHPEDSDVKRHLEFCAERE